MDLLQVLEGLAYVGFIAGAIFAVYELQSIKKDRRSEIMLRSMEMFCSHDFEVATVNAVKADFEPGKVSDVDAKSIADYFEFLGGMARKKLADKDVVLTVMSFEGMWEMMHPWILHWERLVGEGRFPDFEWMAGEERRDRLAREQKAKAA